MTTHAADVQVRLHGVESVMRQLGIGRSSVYEVIKSGELRSVTVGKRRLIPETAIAEFIERRLEQSTPPVRTRKPAPPVPGDNTPA